MRTRPKRPAEDFLKSIGIFYIPDDVDLTFDDSVGYMDRTTGNWIGRRKFTIQRLDDKGSIIQTEDVQALETKDRTMGVIWDALKGVLIQKFNAIPVQHGLVTDISKKQQEKEEKPMRHNNLHLKMNIVPGGRGQLRREGDGIAFVLAGLPETSDNRTGERLLEIVGVNCSRRTLAERFSYWAQENGAAVKNPDGSRLVVSVVHNVRDGGNRYGSAWALAVQPADESKPAAMIGTMIPFSHGYGAVKEALMLESLSRVGIHLTN